MSVKRLSQNAKSYWSLGLVNAAAIPLTMGAVYCTDQLLPSQTTWLKNLVARYIIKPNLPIFEKLGKGIATAHQEYDERKRLQAQARGEEVPDNKPGTPEEKAYHMADGIVRTLVGLSVDLAVTWGGMHLMEKLWIGKKVGSGFISNLGLAAQMGSILAMPTLVPRMSENIHYGTSHLIQKITGMSREKADDLAQPFTYVNLPGLMSMGVEFAALYGTNKWGKGTP